MARKTTLTPYGVSGQPYSFAEKTPAIVVISLCSSTRFKFILPLLKNKDINWARSYTGLDDTPEHLCDVYPIILYIEQEKEFDLHINSGENFTLER